MFSDKKKTEQENCLMHHGIKGQKWGIRRYQNEDRTRTPLGKKHELELKRQEGRYSKNQKRAERYFNIKDSQDLDYEKAAYKAERIEKKLFGNRHVKNEMNSAYESRKKLEDARSKFGDLQEEAFFRQTDGDADFDDWTRKNWKAGNKDYDAARKKTNLDAINKEYSERVAQIGKKVFGDSENKAILNSSASKEYKTYGEFGKREVNRILEKRYDNEVRKQRGYY